MTPGAGGLEVKVIVWACLVWVVVADAVAGEDSQPLRTARTAYP